MLSTASLAQSNDHWGLCQYLIEQSALKCTQWPFWVMLLVLTHWNGSIKKNGRGGRRKKEVRLSLDCQSCFMPRENLTWATIDNFIKYVIMGLTQLIVQMSTGAKLNERQTDLTWTRMWYTKGTFQHSSSENSKHSIALHCLSMLGFTVGQQWREAGPCQETMNQCQRLPEMLLFLFHYTVVLTSSPHSCHVTCSYRHSTLLSKDL